MGSRVLYFGGFVCVVRFVSVEAMFDLVGKRKIDAAIMALLCQYVCKVSKVRSRKARHLEGHDRKVR